MDKNTKLHTWLTILFAVLLVAGALLFTLDVLYAEVLFSVGALLAIVQSFVYALQNRTEDVRLARLHRLNFIATLFLGAAAWMMWQHNTSWVPMMLVYALVVFFLSFRGGKK